MIKLVSPTYELKDTIMQYRKETLEQDGSVKGGGGLAKYDNYDDWFQKLNDVWKDSRTWAAFANDRMVGIINLRWGLDLLYEEVGHIGYSVRPSRRGQGYGTQMLKLCLKEAQLLGMGFIYVVADFDNIGSTKIIQSAGGVLVSSYEAGEKPACGCYSINLKV